MIEDCKEIMDYKNKRIKKVKAMKKTRRGLLR